MVVAAFTQQLVTVGDDGVTVINGETQELVEMCEYLRSIFRRGRIVAFLGLIPAYGPG